MKKYIGVKIIQAKPMNLGEYNLNRGWTIPANEDPTTEGYRITYEDGYLSWSPKNIFEEAYRTIGNLTFGLAIEALKKGKKVARTGWNGKGMYVYYIPAASYKASTENAKKEFGDMVPYEPYLAIKNVKGTISTWVPSINDCLAEDWEVIE